MTAKELIKLIKTQPDKVEFDQVIDCIHDNYEYSPTHFTNGQGHDLVNNLSGSNEGSCKIFAFATLNGLNEEETLACFGKYYREDVLNHPEGNDHANIRTFMRHGWSGIQFEGTVLI
ncbi:MAG: HopJ type III effector protein [Gammaproteobacteria bacterium]